jgi:Mlc titration factor MtfA (ptsG expression regulator)
MVFSWLRKRRRQKLLSQPFPAEWLETLRQDVPHYVTLTDEEQAKLHNDLRIFIAEKDWEGCGGLELTDSIKVTVAGFACLLVLGMEEVYFDRAVTILVYPRAYVVPDQPSEDGLLMEDRELEGEAHYRGPVILNWEEIVRDAHAPEFGRNLVFHEFAHQLDMLNGEADGIPALPDPAGPEQWERLLNKELRRLRHDVDRGEPTVLDDYGAENEAEFFAVATECFFLQPKQLRQKHGDLYELFRGYYNQDPAERSLPWGEFR